MRSSYRLALAGVAAAALLAAGCSSSGSSSSSGTNWATQTSASAGGGMAALVAAAQKEGTLNVIAVPPTWANYGAIISAFTAKYGIKINSANPTGTSQQEVDAVKSENGTAKAPDVLDIGMAVALANTKLFAPYKVATWGAIPSAQKVSGRPVVPGLRRLHGDRVLQQVRHDHVDEPAARPEVPQRRRPERQPDLGQRGAERRDDGEPAAGGTPDNIAKGVDFFSQLKKAGNFSPVSATGATIKAGTTPVVFNWDYLNLPSYVGVSNWKVFIPPHAILGGYYAQAINKNAPHPAAARLWEEFLYSQAAVGGQNLWLKGGARPVQQAAMTANGTINQAAAALLPNVPGSPTFLSAAQSTDAANYLAANWAKAVG